ncbi:MULTISPECIES: iron-containing redox enzyme family protein [unclassified Caballeronia]|jgi:pyrroloquinoline quinone (PQQ) biosynthesis protein C|uniref:iron-containing redox enzyme family protein n=1 Tax=unclassified Caballeronia TaxID=2646786 RepID=UPI001FD42932|nr:MULTISPECIES: iron-containing redox enzyme family protein [unclassified Caballeronia]MDR5777218.1 iron-containing redox enzyme family protein [Caballeronia sp. LZ002]MDR5852656.1 iron-containing redox enzyme family protein [Caballeronia sp. LZ003]
MLDRTSVRDGSARLSTKNFSDELEALARSAMSSGALDNDFYSLWTRERLNARQIAIFARNYGEFNRAFPEVLAVMISSTRNVVAQAEYAKTLYSEMGYGNPEKVHSILFDAWLSDLGRKIGEGSRLDWASVQHDLKVLPETQALIEGEKRLYGDDNATAAGAQLALEWQAYTMLRKLYDGALVYKDLWEEEDEFHESCEYFYAHIGATEKEHKVESLSAAKQFVSDTDALTRLTAGFNTHLQLFERFWNAVAREMMSVKSH